MTWGSCADQACRTCAGLRMSHRMMLWSLYTTASCAMLLLKEQPTAAGNRCAATSPAQQQQPGRSCNRFIPHMVRHAETEMAWCALQGFCQATRW